MRFFARPGNRHGPTRTSPTRIRGPRPFPPLSVREKREPTTGSLRPASPAAAAAQRGPAILPTKAVKPLLRRRGVLPQSIRQLPAGEAEQAGGHRVALRMTHRELHGPPLVRFGVEIVEQRLAKVGAIRFLGGANEAFSTEIRAALHVRGSGEEVFPAQPGRRARCATGRARSGIPVRGRYTASRGRAPPASCRLCLRSS